MLSHKTSSEERRVTTASCCAVSLKSVDRRLHKPKNKHAHAHLAFPPRTCRFSQIASQKAQAVGFFFFPPFSSAFTQSRLLLFLRPFHHAAAVVHFYFVKLLSVIQAGPVTFAVVLKKKRKKSFSCSLSFIFFYSLLK